MPIDLDWEIQYHTEHAHRQSRVAAALARSDVQAAIRLAPDATGLSGAARLDGPVVVTLYADLGEAAEIADLSSYCDADYYRLDREQTLFDDGDVQVVVKLTGRAKLSRSDKRLLKDLGKLKVARSTYRTIACAA
jgi:hypothetical protein